MGNRLTSRELATKWGISQQRVHQLKKSGRITPGPDGRYDESEVEPVRAKQIADHPQKTLMSVSTNGVTVTGPKIDAMAGFDADAFFEDTPVPPTTAPSAVTAALDSTARMMTMRERKMQLDIERIEARNQRELGHLISRDLVRQQFEAAAKAVQVVLNALPGEIAAVFADHDRRAQVHRSVEAKVEQALDALHKVAAKVTPDDQH